MSPDVPTWNRALRFLFTGTILLQSVIILACVALEYANTAAGFLQYRLPQFVFWVFVWVGIGAPSVALATLVALWTMRASLWSGPSNTSAKALRHLVGLCLVNVAAVAVWFAFGGRVFFGAGGNR